MGVNIKNPETERLIRELAELTGESQTQAVRSAVIERIDRFRSDKQARIDRIMAIARETAPLLKDLDMDEALYGENGLYDRERAK